jgi:hypothetical protein
MHVDVLVFYNSADIAEDLIDKEVEHSIDYFDPDKYTDYYTVDSRLDEVIKESYMLITYNDLINRDHVDAVTYDKMADSFKQRFDRCRVYDAHI